MVAVVAVVGRDDNDAPGRVSISGRSRTATEDGGTIVVGARDAVAVAVVESFVGGRLVDAPGPLIIAANAASTALEATVMARLPSRVVPGWYLTPIRVGSTDASNAGSNDAVPGPFPSSTFRSRSRSRSRSSPVVVTSAWCPSSVRPASRTMDGGRGSLDPPCPLATWRSWSATWLRAPSPSRL